MTDVSAQRRYDVAEKLLGISAVELFNPTGSVRYYVYASGGKGPVYCDNRLTLEHPLIRRYIRDQFTQLLEDYHISCDVIAGTSTAGVPHATLLADLLNKPLAYVRGKAKDHGKGKQVEGAGVNGKRVVLIEDLVNTGGSSVEAVQALRAEGGIVDYCLAIMTYNREDARQAFEHAQCNIVTLTDIETILDIALNHKASITTLDRDEVLAWRDNPEAWAQQRGIA